MELVGSKAFRGTSISRQRCLSLLPGRAKGTPLWRLQGFIHYLGNDAFKQKLDVNEKLILNLSYAILVAVMVNKWY